MSAQASVDTPESQENRIETTTDSRRWRSGPLKGLVFGLVGGVITTVILHASYPVFLIPEELRDLPTPAPVEDLAKHDAAMIVANCYNAIFAVGLLGAVVGATLAIGEGVTRGSLAKALAVSVGCAVIGAASGCLAGWFGHLVLQACRPLEELTPLARTIRVQGVILGTVGAGIGFGLGALMGRRLKTTLTCFVAGIMAGVMAGMVYPFLTAVLMPGVHTERLIPKQIGSHFLWMGLSTGLLGLMIYGVAQERVAAKKSHVAPPGAAE